MAEDLISSDWLEKTLAFIDRARRELTFQSFIAEKGDRVTGSASCQLFAGLYPSPFTPEYRQYGQEPSHQLRYIWNVYVDTAYHRQGIASQLTSRAINYLKTLGCTRVILHASPFGNPVYERLGFVVSNEMRLDL